MRRAVATLATVVALAVSPGAAEPHKPTNASYVSYRFFGSIRGDQVVTLFPDGRVTTHTRRGAEVTTNVRRVDPAVFDVVLEVVFVKLTATGAPERLLADCPDAGTLLIYLSDTGASTGVIEHCDDPAMVASIARVAAAIETPPE